MGGEADRSILDADEDESDHDDCSLNVGPLGTRSRGKLPPQEVFKHITFSDKPADQAQLKHNQTHINKFWSTPIDEQDQ
jgi:hypothetical protein